jgi:hypothetical protein
MRPIEFELERTIRAPTDQVSRFAVRERTTTINALNATCGRSDWPQGGP